MAVVHAPELVLHTFSSALVPPPDIRTPARTRPGRQKKPRTKVRGFFCVRVELVGGPLPAHGGQDDDEGNSDQERTAGRPDEEHRSVVTCRRQAAARTAGTGR